MTPLWDDIFQSSFDDVINPGHGETVTYTPFGGSGVSITAVWHPRIIERRNRPDAEKQVKAGTIECSLVDVASPSDRDQFTISGDVYAVERFISVHPSVVASLAEYTGRTLGSVGRVERGA